MCLERAITTPPDGDYKRAWKVLLYRGAISGGKWHTPVLGVRAKQTLTASSAPAFYRDCLGGEMFLDSGAIHCYRTKEAAENALKSWNGTRVCDVFEVIGTGHVAHNDTEIAFRSVRFVDRLSEWYIPQRRK